MWVSQWQNDLSSCQVPGGHWHRDGIQRHGRGWGD